MNTITNIPLRILLKVGERTALLLILVPALFLILSEHPTPAHSQEAQISFQRQEGSWYKNDVLFQTPPENPAYSYSITTQTITPTPTPTATPTPEPQKDVPDDIWERLAQCESKGNWSINTGNGYYGGLQFSEGAWRSVGGEGLPHEHSRDEQIARGKMLQEKRGWGPWGACSKKLGLL